MSAAEAEISLSTEEIRSWSLRVLQRYGMFAVDAEQVVARLIESESRGRRASGLRVLQEIVAGFDQGDIDPRARTLTTLDLPAYAAMDGSTGVGQVGASRAMQLAIEKSRTAGIALVVIRNSQPCGDVRVVAELASKAGCLGFCTTNFAKARWPAPAEESWLATHPQSWSFPGSEDAGWTAVRELSAEDFAAAGDSFDGVWQGVVSLALTAGLSGSRMPGVKKKDSAYGAGAEHCCLAVDLKAVTGLESWSKWTGEYLPRAAGLWQRIYWQPWPEVLTLNLTAIADLEAVARMSRIPLPNVV